MYGYLLGIFCWFMRVLGGGVKGMVELKVGLGLVGGGRGGGIMRFK